MKRPWQVWLTFAICLLLMIPAMIWLSMKALDIEKAQIEFQKQTETARRYAELQERISSALWRMDWMLTPLVAQEAARPYYLYEPFYPVATGNQIPQPSFAQQQPMQQMAPARNEQPPGEQQSVQRLAPQSDKQFDPQTREEKAVQKQIARTVRPSPLLVQPSEYIVLHFQIDSQGNFRSPQNPQSYDKQQAIRQFMVLPENIERSEKKLEQISMACDFDTLCKSVPDQKLPIVQPSQTNWPNKSLASQVAGNKLSTDYLLDNQQSLSMKNQSGRSKPVPRIPAPIGSKSYPGKGKEPISAVQQERNVTRGQQEYDQRIKSTQNYAMGQWLENSQAIASIDADGSVFVHEGVMRPIWIGNELVLARRVDKGDETIIQCCWLDWEKIKVDLENEVKNLIPDFELKPLKASNEFRAGRTLATLPVELAVDATRLISTLDVSADSDQPESPLSGLKLALLLAWLGLGVSAIAGAVLLQGVMTLSERRGTFVSAVTHELRTPLTSFRMYAEMLSERMIPDPETQREYAGTLKVEADRLSHLVENVLQYARLERTSRVKRTETSVEELLHRFDDRLYERAHQAEMKLAIDLDASVNGQTLKTEPSSVEQIIFNLVDNACKYARSTEQKQIDLICRYQADRFIFEVRDYGPGINPKESNKLFRAFCKSDQQAADTAQGVGLGLALCKRMAGSLGGKLSIKQPASGDGVIFVLELPG